MIPASHNWKHPRDILRVQLNIRYLEFPLSTSKASRQAGTRIQLNLGGEISRAIPLNHVRHTNFGGNEPSMRLSYRGRLPPSHPALLLLQGSPGWNNHRRPKLERLARACSSKQKSSSKVVIPRLEHYSSLLIPCSSSLLVGNRRSTNEDVSYTGYE